MIKKYTQKEVKLRDKLNRHTKEFMFAHLLRIPVLFTEAKALLKPDSFSMDDAIYANVWAAALKIAEDHNGDLPTEGLRTRLEVETKTLVEKDGRISAISEENFFSNESGFFQWVFDELKSEELVREYGSALLSQFLEEILVVTPLRTSIAELGDNVPENLSDWLKTTQDKLHKIRTVGANPAVSAFPDSLQTEGIGIHSTGLPFFDDWMNGGHAPGESYIVLGPTGVGKTTLAIQIAVAGARYQYDLVNGDLDDPNIGHWYYLIYEYAADPEIFFRIWSHSANIHRDTLWKEFKQDFSTFSRTGDYKPYELLRFSAEMKLGVETPGEYERFVAAKNQLSKHLHVLDMSGSNPNNPSLGAGWVGDIVASLEKERELGRKIAGVVIDDAISMTERAMGERNVSGNDSKYDLMTRLTNEVNRQVATPFHCPVWMFSQLRGKVNDRAPTKAMHHADAEGCSNLPKNAWFGFALGTKDEETSTCLLSCTKSRRAASKGKEHVLFIDGEFCTITSGENKYSIHHATRRIMAKGEVDRLAPTPGKAKKQPNPISIL